MAFTKKAVNDHFLQSFGQEDEPAQATKDGLAVGGYYGTAALALDDGDYGRLQLTAGGAVKVDLSTGEIVASLGTVNLVESGTVTLLEAGTVSAVNNIVTGTQATLGTVGVLNDGSVAITALVDLPGGTVDLVTAVTTVTDVTDVSNLTTGTLASVGTVGVLNDGSVAVTALVDLPGGTVDLVTAVTSVTNLAGGTVQAVHLAHADNFGSAGTIAGTANLIVVGSVAGSAVYVTDAMISTNGASEVTLYSGADTDRIWGPAHLAANGGAVVNFVTPIKTAVGSNLIGKQTGAGTISVSVAGYID